MRAWLIVFLLAGCFAPPEEEPGHPLLGWCPQWQEGPAQAMDGMVDGTWNETFGNGSLDGHPFDGARIRFADVSGTITVSGSNETGGTAVLRDHRRSVGDQIQPRAAIADETDVLLELLLHPIDGDADGGTLRVVLTGNATWSAQVTPLYRVCSAP